jgi:Tfp pilus assembly PilM family ATPase
MQFGKKKIESKEELKKKLAKIEQLEKAKAEQAKPASIIDSSFDDDDKSDDEDGDNPIPAAKAAKEVPPEIQKVTEEIQYFIDNYSNTFTPEGLACSPKDAVIASLLFGILTELKEIKEALKDA